MYLFTVFLIPILIGSIPSAVCNILHLSALFISGSGSNPGVTCAPACLSSVVHLAVPVIACSNSPSGQPTVNPSRPSGQPTGRPSGQPTIRPSAEPLLYHLCSIIAATNVESMYSQWSCTPAGAPALPPCSSPIWPLLVCSGSDVVSLNFYDLYLSGNC